MATLKIFANSKKIAANQAFFPIFPICRIGDAPAGAGPCQEITKAFFRPASDR
jgi:hypothetical protein